MPMKIQYVIEKVSDVHNIYINKTISIFFENEQTVDLTIYRL